MSGAHYFGSAVQLLGDYAVIAGPRLGNSTAAPIAAFRHNGDTWSQTGALSTAASPNPNGFGEALALSGETLVVGAPWQATATGAAYAFTVDSLSLFGNGFEPE